MKQRSNKELADLIARRRRPKSEETKQKIREGNLKFWRGAKEAYEKMQKATANYCNTTKD